MLTHNVYKLTDLTIVKPTWTKYFLLMPYFGFMDNVVNFYLQSKILMANGIQIITIKHKIWDRICICQTLL